MGNGISKIYTSIVFVLLAVQISSAQTFDMQSIPGNNPQFGFGFYKAFYATNQSTSDLSGAYKLTANIPLSSAFNITGSIPYVVYNYSMNFGYYQYSYSANGLGNIFIGLQTKSSGSRERRSNFTLGFYLPTADEKASYSGLIADYYHIPAYIPNLFSIYFNYAFHRIRAEGFNYGIEVGPDLLIPTKGSGSKTELYAHYGLEAGFRVNKFSLNAEFSGIAIISEDVQNFEDRFSNTINFGARLYTSNVIPQIFYKLYFRKEIKNTIDGVLGIGVFVSVD